MERTGCSSQAAGRERQAEQAERERQEQEHQEVEAAKAGGWLGRWRS